jgi:hypothetical protein
MGGYLVIFHGLIVAFSSIASATIAQNGQKTTRSQDITKYIVSPKTLN